MEGEKVMDDESGDDEDELALVKWGEIAEQKSELQVASRSSIIHAEMNVRN